MSISEMGVMCSKMSFRQKRKHLNIERNQQRVRVLYQRCLKTGVHIVIFMKYILELFIHKLYTFGIQCHRRCQCLANKEFVRRRTEQSRVAILHRGFKASNVILLQPMEKKIIDNTLKVMCKEGGIQGRKVNYRAEKTAIRSLILAVVPQP